MSLQYFPCDAHHAVQVDLPHVRPENPPES